MIELYKITQDLVASIKTIVPDVFPSLAPQGTSLPFVTYTRTGVNPGGSKDGEYELDVTYTINLITGDYQSGLQYIDAIRQALRVIQSNHYKYEYTLVGANEQAFDDGWSQALTVNLNVTRK